MTFKLNNLKSISFQCLDNQFSCDDGSCISLDQRCDKIMDCLDESDEATCDLITYNSMNYKKSLPPISRNEQTEIQLSLNILAIDNINEQDTMFKATINVNLYWNDPRLAFQNLKESQNFLDKEAFGNIWLPPLTFSNTDSNAQLLDENSLAIQILKQGNPTMSKTSSLTEDAIFSGKENSLNLQGIYTLDFHCSMKLLDYPFDTQECSIDLELPMNLRNFTKLVAKNLTYEGPEQLLQFKVSEPYSVSNEDGSILRSSFNLYRNPAYHLINTYMPSFAILMMGLLTLFLDEKMHFTTTIMLILTDLICLNTLFQTSLSDMPKTAYMKFIDYWAIFCLAIACKIFITLIVWEYFSQKKGKTWKGFKNSTRFGVPMVFFVGTIIFSMVALAKQRG